jgi:hypothetical protein
VDYIFGAFGPSNIFKIDVLNVPSHQDNGATLTITAGSHNKTHIQQIVDIEQIFEEGQIVLDGQTIPISLGLTAEDATRAASSKLKELERQIFDQVSKRMTAEREEHTLRVNELKETHKLEVKELKDGNLIKTAEMKKTISDLEAEVKSSSEWRALYLAKSDIAKHDSEVHTYHTKRHEAEERTQKARLATAAETTKLFHTVAKIASGVILGVAVPWVYNQFTSD